MHLSVGGITVFRMSMELFIHSEGKMNSFSPFHNTTSSHDWKSKFFITRIWIWGNQLYENVV